MKTTAMTCGICGKIIKNNKGYLKPSGDLHLSDAPGPDTQGSINIKDLCSGCTGELFSVVKNMMPV